MLMIGVEFPKNMHPGGAECFFEPSDPVAIFAFSPWILPTSATRCYSLKMRQTVEAFALILTWSFWTTEIGKSKR